MKLAAIARQIQPGDTVYTCISRVGDTVGACRYMTERVMRDSRPATPRRILSAIRQLEGYGGALVRHQIAGEEPAGIYGPSDAVSLARLAQQPC